MVDDPFTYGRIAATNALSDIYAMGGRALTALTLVCFPQEGDTRVLEQIMCGGLSVMEQAGCIVLGGHSVRDAEIKFGYAVTGLIHPDRILRNTTARPGDALIFTKAIGTGVITTALKQGKAQPAWVEAAIVSMTTLNKVAGEIISRPEFQVHAATDVTGFGLMGHARELAFGSNVRLRIDPASIALLEGAMEAVRPRLYPGWPPRQPRLRRLRRRRNCRNRTQPANPPLRSSGPPVAFSSRSQRSRRSRSSPSCRPRAIRTHARLAQSWKARPKILFSTLNHHPKFSRE